MYLHRGKIDYQVQLQDTPLCMDYKDGYIAIGTSDGKVIFLKGSTGSHLLYFQTQTDKVRSVHLSTTNVLFTGSGDGRVVKWDLSGASSSEDTAVSNTKQQLLNEISTRPTRFLDYYFLEVRANVMNSVSTATTTQQRQLSSKADTSSSSSSSSSTTASQSQSTLTKGALMVYQDDNHRASVVSVQGDEDKLVVAYDDGTVSCWETATGKNLFDLKGRSKLISTVQYDDTRLIADGTYSAVVLHDFSDSPSAHNESSDELVLVLNSYGDEEEEEENDLKLE